RRNRKSKKESQNIPNSSIQLRGEIKGPYNQGIPNLISKVDSFPNKSSLGEKKVHVAKIPKGRIDLGMKKGVGPSNSGLSLKQKKNGLTGDKIVKVNRDGSVTLSSAQTHHVQVSINPSTKGLPSIVSTSKPSSMNLMPDIQKILPDATMSDVATSTPIPITNQGIRSKNYSAPHQKTLGVSVSKNAKLPSHSRPVESHHLNSTLRRTLNDVFIRRKKESHHPRLSKRRFMMGR
ncbi:hypothetical protein LINGRAHAP2_LOCUS31294, partial [Linum grandiflorum]